MNTKTSSKNINSNQIVTHGNDVFVDAFGKVLHFGSQEKQILSSMDVTIKAPKGTTVVGSDAADIYNQ